MTELHLDTLTMPSTNFGGDNPLPPLISMRTASAHHRTRYHGEDAFVSPQDQLTLPYLLQDQYDRTLTPRTFKTAVLENNFLRVEFLLELGGRMWSLIDKTTTTTRELLFKNPVFRLGNLACRDAWFSGGVEWNVSLIAHSPSTCSPLFAAKIIAADNTPVLRLYEWDRLRGIPWQIDFYLPENSRYLFVRPRIINPWDRDLPMYWWSNIAIPEDPGARVIGPADGAWRHDYNGQLVSHPLPIIRNIDVTYPGRRPNASDCYFNIQQGQRPWIASIDAQGYGFVHSSTSRMYGRKIFTWGTAPGGRHWQEFLSLPGHAYVELQGGLAPTQGTYLRMPPHARWDWLESYGPLHADPAKAHGPDWQQAIREVESQLEKALSRTQMDQIHAATSDLPDRIPTEILHQGSGWGALERRRREIVGQPPQVPAALPYPDTTLGNDQKPWLELAEKGALPARNPTDTPLSPIIQKEWRDLLEASLKTSQKNGAPHGNAGLGRPESGDHWLSWYQLGIMRFGAGDLQGAKTAWETSIARTPSAWALRNLAVLATHEEKLDQAVDLLAQAVKLQPALLPLAVQYGRALFAAARYQDVVDFIASLPPHLQTAGRIQLLKAQTAVALNDFANADRFFAQTSDIANIREQELSLSDLWFELHAKRIALAENCPNDEALMERVRKKIPPPRWADFRTSK
ncbi:MAG: DUF5107 domain-containing protein [Phycisphaerales bacterium]|nr:DUF5107 domain-containing protein [Phycisphaerales bacterium]